MCALWLPVPGTSLILCSQSFLLYGISSLSAQDRSWLIKVALGAYRGTCVLVGDRTQSTPAVTLRLAKRIEDEITFRPTRRSAAPCSACLDKHQNSIISGGTSESMRHTKSSSHRVGPGVFGRPHSNRPRAAVLALMTFSQ